MGFLDALLGRSKPQAANLDHLFGLPGARITLEATEGIMPTGQAGVCFKPGAGAGFEATETELTQLLNLGDGPNQAQAPLATLTPKPDSYGYQWIVINDTDFDSLVTRVHVVNSTLHEHGYDTQLLCSVFGFAKANEHASAYLVYLYKRGTFYAFVPTGSEKRDNEAEIRLKDLLVDDLSMEPELDRWFPLWELPVH